MNEEIKIIRIDSYTSLNSSLGQKLLELCRSAQSDSTLMAKNISDENWQQRPESLLHCLYTEKRFDNSNGQLLAALLNGEMVAVGGVYRSDFSPDNISVAGSRTYTKIDHRNRFWHGEFLIPEQVKWSVQQNMSMVLFSFNRESLPLMGLLKRAIEKKAGVLGLMFPEIYKNLHEHPKTVCLKNTPQRILKLYIKPEFDWDFTLIETEEVL